MKITKETKKKIRDIIARYLPRFMIACITTAIVVTILNVISIVITNFEFESLEVTNVFLLMIAGLFSIYLIIWVWYKFSEIGSIQEVKIAK